MQHDESMRYLGELAGGRIQEHPFALNPHMSGFESTAEHAAEESPESEISAGILYKQAEHDDVAVT